MIINTHGDKNNDKILLLHPMLTSADFFASVVEELSDKYYLIVPTLSGHHENSEYISIYHEEAYIDEFLKENNIDSLMTVAGFSLGGNIAFDYFCRHQDLIDNLVIDSAPLFRFPPFLKNALYKRFETCLINVKNNPENAVEELNVYFNKMGEFQKHIAPTVSLSSLKNLTESCFNVRTPFLSARAQRKISFLYGKEDISRISAPRARKYLHSRFVTFNNMAHCEYYAINPKEYAAKFIVPR